MHKHLLNEPFFLTYYHNRKYEQELNSAHWHVSNYKQNTHSRYYCYDNTIGVIIIKSTSLRQ